MSVGSTINRWADRIDAIGGKEHELSHLPKARRRTVYGLIAVWSAATIVPSAFLTGGSVGNSLTLWEFVGSFFAGSFLMFLVAISVGFVAQDFGLTFHTLSRYFFGNKGSYLPSGLQIITRLGWGAVSLAFAASFVVEIIDIESFFVASAILGILYMLTALVGFDGMKWVSYVAIPVFLGVYIWGLAVPLGFEMPSATPAEPIPFTEAVGIAAGFWAAGALVAGDWLRYGRSKKDIVVSSGIALLGFNMINLGLGYLSVVSTGNSDMSAGIAQAGFILPATIALVLITWTTVDNWLYSGSLGVSNIFGIRKVFAVIGIAVAMILLAGLQIHTYIIPWIQLLGVFLPPLAGPILVEYYVHGNRMEGLSLHDIDYNVNWTAIGAWAIASGVAYFTPTVYVVPVVGIAVSLVTYYLLSTVREDWAVTGLAAE